LSVVWPQPWTVGTRCRSNVAASPVQVGAIATFAAPTGLPDRYSDTWCICSSLRPTAIGRMMPIDSES
jgi:hypothetical protein